MPLCRETPGSLLRPSRTVTIGPPSGFFVGHGFQPVSKFDRLQNLSYGSTLIPASRRRPLKRSRRESVRWDLSRTTWTPHPSLLGID